MSTRHLQRIAVSLLLVSLMACASRQSAETPDSKAESDSEVNKSADTPEVAFSPDGLFRWRIENSTSQRLEFEQLRCEPKGLYWRTSDSGDILPDSAPYAPELGCCTGEIPSVVSIKPEEAGEIDAGRVIEVMPTGDYVYEVAEYNQGLLFRQHFEVHYERSHSLVDIADATRLATNEGCDGSLTERLEAAWVVNATEANLRKFVETATGESAVRHDLLELTAAHRFDLWPVLDHVARKDSKLRERIFDQIFRHRRAQEYEEQLVAYARQHILTRDSLREKDFRQLSRIVDSLTDDEIESIVERLHEESSADEIEHTVMFLNEMPSSDLEKPILSKLRRLSSQSEISEGQRAQIEEFVELAECEREAAGFEELLECGGVFKHSFEWPDTRDTSLAENLFVDWYSEQVAKPQCRQIQEDFRQALALKPRISTGALVTKNLEMICERQSIGEPHTRHETIRVQRCQVLPHWKSSREEWRKMERDKR